MSPVALYELLPDPEALLALEPEELAGVILQYLHEAREGELNRYNFSVNAANGYPPQYQERVSHAVMEAWVWLEHEGMVAPKPRSQGEWIFITRRGKKMATPEDVRKYRRANILPRQLLHPILVQKVWASFLRGDYDTAVFQSFKEVEVRVREASGLRAADVGVTLMRNAFHPGNGPLTDAAAPPGEREALMHLFAGAIGSYKNPHSHRSITIEPEEAVEMIFLGSHLLGIVDKRASRKATPISKRKPRRKPTPP